MKKIYFVIILLFSLMSYGANLQVDDNNADKTNTNKINKEVANSAKPNYAYWGPYMRALEAKIKSNWNPPKIDSSRRIKVVFTISKDGKLLSLNMTKSSGNKKADEAALKAIKSTAPFKPLPSEFNGESVPVEFTFDYNVIDKEKLDSELYTVNTHDANYSKKNYTGYAFRQIIKILYDNKEADQNLASSIHSYTKYIDETIKEKLKQSPIINPNKELDTCIRFNIHKDGTYSDINTVRTSESKAFDNYALKTIEKVGKFNALPKEIKDEYITVQYTLKYKLNANL